MSESPCRTIKKKEKKVKQENKGKHKIQNKTYKEREKKWKDAFGDPEEDSSDSSSSDEKPNFVPSGNLKKGTAMMKKGVELKYLPPKEAAKPEKKYRIYVFKDSVEKRVLHLHRKDHFLFGKDRKVADINLHHVSISSQHAVLQYRQKTKKNIMGETTRKILPYLIDLDSSNGTFINKEKMVPRKYYQLLAKDVITFGKSTREYVFIPQDEVLIDYKEEAVYTKSGIELLRLKQDKEDPKSQKEEDLWEL